MKDKKQILNRSYKGQLKSIIKKFDAKNAESFIALQSYAANCRRKGIIPKNRIDRIISKYANKMKNEI